MPDRIETDSMGDITVPEGALYGAQTQRAVNNFDFSGRSMPASFIRRLATIKYAAARANTACGVLEAEMAQRIEQAAQAIMAGDHSEQFPVDVFQTGSGTSTNMNMNEVLARLAGDDVHPNDHVNASQSSNDVIPTCLQVSVALELGGTLLPALQGLHTALVIRGNTLENAVKTGRTHLMDAMPVTLGQELGTWAYQLKDSEGRLRDAMERLARLPLGGTAVGTGVNCPPGFREAAIDEISRVTGFQFLVCENSFSRMSAIDCAVEVSSCLRGLAVVLMKIANDLRWMSSGPLAGLGEIELPALQPGSSIMPGKVNPVIPEAVAMACVDVMGNDATVGIAGQSGNFQLNVMLPLVADKLLGSTALLSRALASLVPVIDGFTVNQDRLDETLARNPILVTALNRMIGYEKAAAIAKEAYAGGRTIVEVAAEQTDLSKEELGRLLDPMRLTGQDAPES